MFIGFRTSEVLTLTIGQPIGPELHHALDGYLAQRARKHPFAPTDPLFRSRFHAADGGPKPITRSMAEKIIKRAFRVISDATQGLSSHSLCESWARQS